MNFSVSRFVSFRSLGLKNIPELFDLSKALADVVIPQVRI